VNFDKVQWCIAPVYICYAKVTVYIDVFHVFLMQICFIELEE